MFNNNMTIFLSTEIVYSLKRTFLVHTVQNTPTLIVPYFWKTVTQTDKGKIETS